MWQKLHCVIGITTVIFHGGTQPVQLQNDYYGYTPFDSDNAYNWSDTMAAHRGSFKLFVNLCHVDKIHTVVVVDSLSSPLEKQLHHFTW